MLRTSIVAGVVAAGLTVLGATPARAQYTADKMTYLTFSGPVQIPGVTLTAGTYRFHLTDNTTTRKVMQVLSRDGSTVYSQFNTIHDWRPKATYESTVTFRETRADAPPAVRSLFYGWERDGYEFVYSKNKSVAEVAAVSLKTEPVKVEEALVAEASPAPAAIAPEPTEPLAPAPEPAAVLSPAPEPAAPQSNEAKELPKTASSMPAIALTGFVAMLLGFGVSALRRRLTS